MDKRIESAAKLPTARIEESIPPSLLQKLKEIGRCLSVSWVGIYAGLFVPLQYVMDYSLVELDQSLWTDPLIVWPLIHAPSGTRKSRIHSFVNSLLKFEEYFETENEENQALPQYKVQETTFENLGLVMQNNRGRVIWFFDEARHFFAQLGYYNKGGSTRDENLLLSLYDGGEWDHGTSGSKSTKFKIPKTHLVLGGCTQTAHIVSLFQNQEQMQSGLIPRFLILMLEPVRTPIEELGKGNQSGFKEELRETFQSIQQNHQGRELKYVIKQKSKAYHIFSKYYESVNEWCKKHEYEMAYQHAITLVSKSLGQILRISAMLSAMFMHWNIEELLLFENESPFEGEVHEFTQNDKGEIPISVMALQNSLSLVTYSITQNLLIQNIESFSFDLSSTVPTIRDVKDSCEEIMDGNHQHGTRRTSETEFLPPTSSSSPTSSSVASSSSEHGNEPTSSDIAKVLLSGGKSIDARFINNYKKLGVKTNKKIIFKIFNAMQTFSFGNWKDKNIFVLHENLYERIVENEAMRSRLTEIGVSLAMLREALDKQDNVLQPPKKKLKTNTESSNKSDYFAVPSSIFINVNDDRTSELADITNKL